MKSKSRLPLVLTRYSPDLELSCGTRMVEKIERDEFKRKNLWREKRVLVLIIQFQITKSKITKSHILHLQCTHFISKLHAKIVCSELPFSTLDISPNRCFTCMKQFVNYMQCSFKGNMLIWHLKIKTLQESGPIATAETT